MNNFKDYGFEADFEGEILKEFDEFYIGWATHCDGSGVASCKWYKHSNKYKFKSGTERQNNRSLTPIKKEWYENPDNFPCLLIDDSKEPSDQNKFWYCPSVGIAEQAILFGNLRPSTKEEVLSLLVKE